MNAHEQLIAYLATLTALVIVFLAALVAVGFGADGPTIGQAFGLGTITGGLIGILRIPSQQQRSTGSTESGDVNVAPEVKP
jgi:hypothetical protein